MATKLKPRLYLQVQDDEHMILYYSVLYENGKIVPSGPLEGPEPGPNGEIIYSMKFKEDGSGASHFDGTIPDIPVTKEGPDTKIIFKAIGDHGGVTTAQDDGTGTGHSGDGDDKD